MKHRFYFCFSWARNFENAFPYIFPALPGPLAARSHPDMARKVLSLQNGTGPEMILPFIGRHGADRIWVFTYDIF